jgi:DNA-binding NarL/FixJ family response regulator
MKVLLVDAFPLVRAALTSLLEQRFPGAQVVGVDSVDGARHALKVALPELVLLDLHLPEGLALLQQLHREHLTLPVVVISGSDEADDALEAIRAGAVGYVPERSNLDTLVSALHLVLAGGIYVPPLKAAAATVAPVASAGEITAAALAGLPLTPRQKHVLSLMAQGLPNKSIARELNLSVDTVKDHVAAVLKALGVSSRTQAVLMVQKGQ